MDNWKDLEKWEHSGQKHEIFSGDFFNIKV